MSIRNRRAGRKSWNTRVRFNNEVANFFIALAEKKWKYTVEQTQAISVERTAKVNGSKEVITGKQAINELSLWEGRLSRNAFSNISGDAISDMLCDILIQGSTVVTAKAEYRILEQAN